MVSYAFEQLNLNRLVAFYDGLEGQSASAGLDRATQAIIPCSVAT